MNRKHLKIGLTILLVMGVISGIFFYNQQSNQLQGEINLQLKEDTIQSKESSKINKELEEVKKDKVGIGVGNIAPDFDLINLTGKNVSLSQYRGRYLMVNFWATWCPPCRAEMPDLDAFYNNNKEDFVVLGVNLGESKKEVREFIDKGGYKYPIVLDQRREVAFRYQISAIPTSYFIDPQGRIQYIKRGLVTKEDLNQIKDNLMRIN